MVYPYTRQGKDESIQTNSHQLHTVLWVCGSTAGGTGGESRCESQIVQNVAIMCSDSSVIDVTTGGYPRWAAPSGIEGTPVARAPMESKQLGMVVHTPQLCSCSGCGNTRRHAWFKGERPTLEERRWLVQYVEQLEEIDE